MAGDKREEELRSKIKHAVEFLKETAFEATQNPEELREVFIDLWKDWYDESEIGTKQLEDVVSDIIENLNAKAEGLPGKGLITGLRNIDMTTGNGLYPGLTVFTNSVLSERKGMGEHELAFSIASRIALQGKNVLYLNNNFDKCKRLANYSKSRKIKLPFLNAKYVSDLRFDLVAAELKTKDYVLAVLDDASHLARHAKHLNKIALDRKISCIAVVAGEQQEDGVFFVPDEFWRCSSNVFRFNKLRRYAERKLHIISVFVDRQRDGPHPLFFRLVNFPGTYRFADYSRR